MKREKRGQKMTILGFIRRENEASLENIRESTKINYNSIRSAVVCLTNEGLIERIGRGKYKIRK
jgi:predicted transcriptional regulator of viral defense system